MPNAQGEMPLGSLARPPFMKALPYYESERALSEYLLFHYGTDGQVMPWAFGPRNSLDFPVRCVSELLDPSHLGSKARALDLGCAVGRSSFELARHCPEVIGIDYSEQFIQAAQALQEQGSLSYRYVEEGTLTTPAVASVPGGVDRARVRFERGDAQALPSSLGQFDIVLLANLLDRLAEPVQCLNALPGLVKLAGQVLMTTPCTWLEEYTAHTEWLGGIEREGAPIRTLDTLRHLLEPHFALEQVCDMPFLIREHARKYQWSVAQGSRWRRRSL
jgi:putative 4-mercaptohistidine N1-methyltranferase